MIGKIPLEPPVVHQISAPHFTLARTRDILIALHYLPLMRKYYLGPKGNLHLEYSWDFPTPTILRQITARDSWNDPFNPFILGALYQFEMVNDLPIAHGTYGVIGLPKEVETALLQAKRLDPNAWTWVLVSKFPRPEYARIFVAGRGWVFRTLCNTGVLHATPNGTWPVYARAAHTQMIGRFPIPVSANTVHLYQAAVAAGFSVHKMDFSRYHHHWVRYQHYDDSDIRWVNYFYRGRAVHYYPRASYGFPQSAGCVELPRDAARKVFALLHYGVPVSIVHKVTASDLLIGPPKPLSVHYQYQEVPSLSTPRSVHWQLLPIRQGKHASGDLHPS